MQDFHSLRAFVYVAREGSVTRAANKLHLTQPAVSLKLKHFQQALGLTLFIRHPHGLVLTPEGQALLPAAEKALSACQAFAQTARNMNETLRGSLRIGTIIDPEFIRLGAFLQQLVERAPQIRTELHHGISGVVLERVLKDELDVGFYLSSPRTGLDASSGIAGLELTRFDYRVLAPAGWSSRLEGADWHDLASLPWVTTPAASVHHRLLREALEPLNMAPNSVALVDQESCMVDLVRAGVGLSLVRDTLAMVERQERGLTIVDDIRLTCVAYFVWRNSRRDEPIIAMALEALRESWRLS